MNLSRREFITVTAAGSVLARLAYADEPGTSTERNVPWLDEIQRTPQQVSGDDPQLGPLLVDRDGMPITTLAGWRRRRDELRREWLSFLGPLKLPRPKPVLEVLAEDHPSGCVRQLVRYESEPGIAVEGYLLKPALADGRRPGVVVLHSTVDYTIRQPAGLEGPAEKHFGLKLAQRGMVAFCPRCFLWHDEADYETQVARFKERHPESRGMAKMLWDAVRAVDVLVSLAEVDPARIGAVGHSLGAKETLYLTAFDERIRAAVSSEGGIGTRFSNWDAPWYLGPEIHAEAFEREHHELLALAAPRAFLLIGGDSADGDRSWPFIEAALAVYRLYPGRPKIGLFNHRQGHAVPPAAEARIYEWLDVYL